MVAHRYFASLSVATAGRYTATAAEQRGPLATGVLQRLVFGGNAVGGHAQRACTRLERARGAPQTQRVTLRCGSAALAKAHALFAVGQRTPLAETGAVEAHALVAAFARLQFTQFRSVALQTNAGEHRLGRVHAVTW